MDNWDPNASVRTIETSSCSFAEFRLQNCMSSIGRTLEAFFCGNVKMSPKGSLNYHIALQPTMLKFGAWLPLRATTT